MKQCAQDKNIGVSLWRSLRLGCLLPQLLSPLTALFQWLRLLLTSRLKNKNQILLFRKIFLDAPPKTDTSQNPSCSYSKGVFQMIRTTGILRCLGRPSFRGCPPRAINANASILAGAESVFRTGFTSVSIDVVSHLAL